MGFVSAKCPACAKDIEIPAEEVEFFCPYCGSKFLRDAAYAFAAMPEMSTGDADLSDFVIVGTTLVDYQGAKPHVVIPAHVTAISNDVFFGNKSILSVLIPDSVTSIGMECFKGCTSLSKVAMSNRIVSIGREAFCDCVSLEKIELPHSLKQLGDRAFLGCKSLVTALIPESCDRGSSVFGFCPAKIIKQ